MMMTIAGATVGILLGVLLFLSADFAHTKIAAAPSPQISVATFWENAFFARREAGLPVKLSIPKIKVDANIGRPQVAYQTHPRQKGFESSRCACADI